MGGVGRPHRRPPNPSLAVVPSQAFVISGATNSSYNGLYAKTARVCSGKPVYQKGGSDGWVLYRPTQPLRSDC